MHRHRSAPSTHSDAALTAVAASILMGAVAIVMAAVFATWAVDMQEEPPTFQTVAFSARTVDVPWTNADGDAMDDAIELIFLGPAPSLKMDDVAIFVDGQPMTWAGDHFVQGDDGFQPGDVCGSSPADDADDSWERGHWVYLVATGPGAIASAECRGSIDSPANLGDLTGKRLLSVSAMGHLVLQVELRVSDDAGG